VLAHEKGRLPNGLRDRGHPDARAYRSAGTASGEAAHRADAARRLLNARITPEPGIEVSGFAGPAGSIAKTGPIPETGASASR
jgi:hypothetical protein